MEEFLIGINGFDLAVIVLLFVALVALGRTNAPRRDSRRRNPRRRR